MCGIIAAQSPQKRKHMIVNHLIHLCWGKVLKFRPSQIFISTFFRIYSLWENPPFDRLLGSRRLIYLKRVQIVEPPQKQQVSNLLDHFKRVRNTTRPESIPNSIDLTFNFP